MTLPCLVLCFNLPLLSTQSVCISLLFWIRNGCSFLLTPKVSRNALPLFWTELSDMVYCSSFRSQNFVVRWQENGRTEEQALDLKFLLNIPTDTKRLCPGFRIEKKYKKKQYKLHFLSLSANSGEITGETFTLRFFFCLGLLI